MGNRVFEETEAVATAVRRLSELLPPEWTVESLKSEVKHDDLRADGLVAVTPAVGPAITFLAEVKRWTTEPTSRVAGVLSSLQHRSPYPVLLITDHTNAPLRRVCRDLGVNFVDEAGWVLLRSEDPPILISTEGKDQRAPRYGHEVTRLNGPAVGRIVRALLEIKPPIGVRELQARAGVNSAGSVSKLLPTLAAAGAIERGGRGEVLSIHRRSLLDRWVEDYSFRASNLAVTDWLAPRGIDLVIDRLPAMSGLAVTGGFAGQAYLRAGSVPTVPGRLLALYAESPRAIAEDLGLVQIEPVSSNVVIATPRDRELMHSLEAAADGLPLAPRAQVLADLLSLPGRESLLADQLMEQLAEDDPLWSPR